MTTQYTDLFPHEAKAATENRLGMLIRVVDVKPRGGNYLKHPERKDYFGNYPRESMLAVYSYYGNLREFVQSPFTSGTVLHCREEWGWADEQHTAVQYKEDSRQATDWKDWENDKTTWQPNAPWKSPKKLPSKFIRFRPTVGEAMCKRVKELTLGHWVNAGWLTSIYEAKPITRTEELLQGKWDPIHGAGSWEANPWVWICNLTPTDQP